MQFVMFTDYETGKKIGINRQFVVDFGELENGGTWIILSPFVGNAYEVLEPNEGVVKVKEDFDTVLSRLDTIAE